jgi:poly(3-hydroxybutyrate) depolymerase
MKFELLLVASSFSLAKGGAGSSLRSAGCDAGKLQGRRLSQTVSVTTTPTTTTMPREFLVTAPENPSKTPLPVLFNFHGWGNRAAEIADEHIFDDLAQEHSFIAVYPEGLGDYHGPDANSSFIEIVGARRSAYHLKKAGSWSSWNLGPVQDTECAAGGPDGWKEGWCYDSCKSGCGACSWYTCADDVAFTDAMLNHLQENACVDTSRLYAYGESNGGMFVYRLLAERPGMFAAAAPEQGLPPSGDVATAPVRTSLLHLHDRQDESVPVDGRASDDGWLYTPLDKTLNSACGPAAAPMKATTNATRGQSFECTQRSGCEATEVVACLYDGHHGDLPPGKHHGDQFVWDFLSRHSLSQPYVASSGMEALARRVVAKVEDRTAPLDDLKHM